MSINSAMLAGVSGLVANSSALAAISDNIANVNTVGYKRNQINFSNVVTSQAAAGRYSAGGVQGSLHSYTSQQGLLQTTGSTTDIAISGDGMFVVAEKAQVAPSDSRLFTRAGSFNIDPDGYLVNSAGYYLQGWPVAEDGSVNANPSDMSQLNSINIKNISSAVRASTEISIKANLNSGQTVSADELAYRTGVVAGLPLAADSMAAYAANPANGTKPDFTMQMSVIDSLGASHDVAVSFLKSANANEWHAEIYATNPADISGGTPPGLIRSGTVKFDSNGKLDTDLTHYSGATPPVTPLFANMAEPSLSIGASSATTGVRWAAGLGVNGQDMAFDFGGAGAAKAGALTQLGGASVLKGVGNNGAPLGEVAGVNVDDKGFISAIFDNGEVRQIAQIAIATFANSDGLDQVSGNAYRASIRSGDFSLKKPSEGGAGDLAGSSLEASTVDLSSEFTGLITTQRAYSASSKIILTADQMLEELINIKR